MLPLRVGAGTLPLVRMACSRQRCTGPHEAEVVLGPWHGMWGRHAQCKWTLWAWVASGGGVGGVRLDAWFRAQRRVPWRLYSILSLLREPRAPQRRCF